MRLAAVLLLLAMPAHAAEPQVHKPTTRPATSATKTPAKKAPAHKSPARKPSEKKPAKPRSTKPKPGSAAKPSPPQAAKPASPRPAPVVVPPSVQVPAEPPKGSSTGMPLPRFAALRSDNVRFRTGPGTRYPIEWVYNRKELPVEIEREFEIWRLVRDPEGTKGWVHQATLIGHRTGIVTGAEHVLRQAASDAAPATARLQLGVIFRIVSCEAGSEWCVGQIGDYRGWIKRSEFWGTLPGEAVK